MYICINNAKILSRQTWLLKISKLRMVELGNFISLSVLKNVVKLLHKFKKR